MVDPFAIPIDHQDVATGDFILDQRFLELPDGYEIAEVKTPRAIANRSLEDIGLRDKYNLNLITLERELEVKKNDEIVKEKHIIAIQKRRSK